MVVNVYSFVFVVWYLARGMPLLIGLAPCSFLLVFLSNIQLFQTVSFWMRQKALASK